MTLTQTEPDCRVDRIDGQNLVEPGCRLVPALQTQQHLAHFLIQTGPIMHLHLFSFLQFFQGLLVVPFGV